ncbi:GTP-binding protein sar1 [Mycena rebaudengoi]|nr:GTP-binding protein sar1 [Mycena rebaudengoi]
MFGIAWFWNALARLGLIRKCAKLLVLGLDNAGKTTLCFALKTGRSVSLQPTFRMSSWEELTIGSLNVFLFDLGGYPRGLRLWTDYFSVADAIVYLVDSADAARHPEAAAELAALLAAPELSNVPFLILGTKIDIPGAISEDELRAALGLHPTTGKARAPSDAHIIEVFMCSAPRRTGYEEGFEWLSRFVSNPKSLGSRELIFR